MNLLRSKAIARNDARIMLRDPFPLVMLAVFPLFLMGFLKPVFRLDLHPTTGRAANGAEQVVPGIAILYSFFLVGAVGFAFFREHWWCTWERLRASVATPREIMVGKLAPLVALAVVQQVLLFVGGIALLGLDVRGSLLALAIVGLSQCLSITTLGVALMSLCRTSAQLNTTSNAVLLVAVIGGVLVPTSVLPGWARTLAPASPSYWALKGFQNVILNGGGLGDILRPVAMLAGFSLLFATLALTRFRFEDAKTAGW